ncbi:hypothetical protein [Spiroplasma tabanidicola]|uniref:HIG1 domain-containing protein n=1 Tax=Spiroplasma tabanidicola TaxID=324079 RepID=A0A6I6CCF5_9MOLU|nr:hypothetical protein [Spiroplasma tabanidicola]QGS51654.1 hypothetical protein STABA_v1c02880 [Spiroplasma tabanidicola]
MQFLKIFDAVPPATPLQWVFIILAIIFIVGPGFVWVGLSFYSKSKRRPIPRLHLIMFGVQILGILIGILLIVFGAMATAKS